MWYEQKFLFSLLLTLIAEIPIALVLLKYFYRHKEIKVSSVVFVSILVSTLTLPYFWFILPAYISDRTTYILVGELLVIVGEAIIYSRLLNLRGSESFIISLLANSSSILLGLLF